MTAHHRHWALLVPLAVAALAVTACGSSQPASHQATPSISALPTSAAVAVPSITCADISTELAKVVSDLKTEDTAYQEAWVSGPDGNDLQALINDTQNATSGGDQLSSDAATFHSDASTYLSDNGPDLYPGWQSAYNTVTADINALATDCHQPTAPPG